MLGASQRDSPGSRRLSVLGCVPSVSGGGSGLQRGRGGEAGEPPHPAEGCQQAGVRGGTHGETREGIQEGMHGGMLRSCRHLSERRRNLRVCRSPLWRAMFSSSAYMFALRNKGNIIDDVYSEVLHVI
ncbi:unnamed protein product [Coccothraustes coccothraustes]